MSPTRIALVGYGFAGSVRHRLAWQRDRRAAIVGVFDRDPTTQARATADGLTAVPTLAALADLGADVWSVCTPPDAHAEAVLAGLACGADVVVEKPMAPDAPTCRALTERAEALGRRLCVGHNFLYARAWQTLQAGLRDGRLGPIRQAQAVQWSGRGRAVPPWTAALPGALLGDELPHHLYLLRDLLGELSIAQAWGDPDGPRLEAVLTSPTAPATLSAWMDAPRTEWWIAVAGTRGAALVDLFRDACLWLPGEPTRTYRTIAEAPARLGFGLWGAVAAQAVRRLRGRHLYGTGALLSAFLDARQRGTPVPVSGHDGEAVVALQQALLSGAGLGA